MRRSYRLLTFLLPLAFLACDRTTSPRGDDEDGGASFDGNFDPNASTFVLQRIVATTPDLETVLVDLVGSNVVIDADSGRVSVDVAIRNAGGHALFAPATVWLSDFRPRAVHPINADAHVPSTSAVTDGSFGFHYDGLFGGDGRLDPGETSGRRTWRFEDPGAGPFAFAAHAEFAVVPRPVLSGVVFIDANRNGQRDDDERPLEGGWTVRLVTPSGDVLESEPREGGRYAFPIEMPGLYRVQLQVLIDALYCLTTPNPLEVLLPAGPNGDPQTFENADFGFVFGACGPPIPPLKLVRLEDPNEVEPQDPYTLMDLEIVGDVLRLRVGFSGCSPDHSFQLVAPDSLMADVAYPPVLPWMVLSHDDRGELCDAYFERTLAYDLSPLERFGATVVVVPFRDSNGGIHEFTWRR